MPTDRYNDLAAFRAFLDAKLADPGNDLSLAEVLALREAENQTVEEREQVHLRIGDGLSVAALHRRAEPPTGA
ncbi:hypothetical protein [Paludisphaera rhizosphaerae]|uniref:hypothetical protein n=1 Tax=Paludisphaera rhizosphaerae TaxID=2711216 RepID=UPI0013EAB330|nr:hypothetical protein [Paludisphaera rhizosphaerae]